tara:strand:+ start:196811 stop:197842 length:1032 start_codon:yes stop_codon:yes gene_type:complete
MKKIILFLFLTQFAFSQQPYYDDVDLTLTEEAMYDELQNKLVIFNSGFTFGDARDIFEFTDEDPDNPNNVLLIYGYNDTDGNCTTDRSRDKLAFGGTNCEYNREHVFARSLADPAMPSPDNSSNGIAADPHNLRPSDQQMNNNRGNKKFQDGNGNAGDVGSGNWYPGDEWKGDVARMMMYMYVRYGDRCLPSLVGVGNLEGSTQMLETFLEWNAEDPVSEIEDQRNAILEDVYWNRNPFIDNPYLATVIWGGVPAEDRWGILETQDISAFDFVMYPNPSSGNITITSDTPLEQITVYNMNGQVIMEINPQDTNKSDLKNINSGFYFVQSKSTTGISTKKLIVK